MSGKFIVAMAAVAALGVSTLVASDAFARGGGGHSGGGGHFSSGHAGGFSRGAVHGRSTMTRNVTRNHTRNVSRTSHVTKNKHVGRPNLKRPHHHPHHHFAHYHHGHHWWWWCRHHPYRCGSGTWVDVGVDGGVVPVDGVASAPRVVSAAPAAVCTNDCDYFLKDEPGCYMAKRAFSTPAGDELRCVKICDEGDGKRAEVK